MRNCFSAMSWAMTGPGSWRIYRTQLDDQSHRQFEQIIDRRAVREPLQYITGNQEFWGLHFKVTPDVLIPRPETEFIVEAALRAVSMTLSPVIIDLCTGSGCIAISLAKELPERPGLRNRPVGAGACRSPGRTQA